MRRFLLYAPGSSPLVRTAWMEVGFKLMESVDNNTGQPDVYLWQWCKADNEIHRQSVDRMQPKVFIIIANSGKQIPESLLQVYRQQVIRGETSCFTIGTTIEGKVAVPDWNAYRLEGRLDYGEELKTLAGSIYRFLLEDIFRETADWCGHMSSVVQPL